MLPPRDWGAPRIPSAITLRRITTPPGLAGKASLQALVPSSANGLTLYAQAANTELSNAIVVRFSK